MDEWPASIPPHQLYARLGIGLAPMVVDIRVHVAADDGPITEKRAESIATRSGFPAATYSCEDRAMVVCRWKASWRKLRVEIHVND